MGAIIAGALAPAMGLAQTETTSLPAQLVAAQYTTLSAELPAQIEHITVKEGDRFKAGQTLVDFECSIQQAALTEARAILGAAEKTRAAHNRLLELNSIGTLEVGKATADAAIAQAKVDSARTVMNKCTITAPFSGRVAERKAQAHQYVQPGQALLDILDDSVLEAEFIVPSRWIPALKIGLPLEIMVDETQKSYPAHITRLGAKVDAVSHSVKIIAALDQPFSDLMAGMTGTIKMGSP